MTCRAEDCNAPATDGLLCERHAEDLRRSRAFWHAGRLTLDPMPANEAQLGLSGSRKQNNV